MEPIYINDNYYFGKNNFKDNDIFYGDKMNLKDITEIYLQNEKKRKDEKKDFRNKIKQKVIEMRKHYFENNKTVS